MALAMCRGLQKTSTEQKEGKKYRRKQKTKATQAILIGSRAGFVLLLLGLGFFVAVLLIFLPLTLIKVT